jgi:hypothetical protein
LVVGIRDTLRLLVRRLPQEIPVKMLFEDAIFAVAVQRASDTGLQSSCCDPSVCGLSKSTIRVVLEQKVDKFHSTAST